MNPLRLAVDALKDALARGIRVRDDLRAYVYEYVTLGRVPRDGESEAIDEAMAIYAEVLDEEIERGKRLRLACTDGRFRVVAPRPCLHLDCRYHLGEAPDPRGRPSTRTRDMTQSCALDVAAGGSHGLKSVGDVIGVTRERVRQIQNSALRKLRPRAHRAGLDLGDIIDRPHHALDVAEEVAGISRSGRDLVKLRASVKRYQEKRKAKAAGAR